MKLHFDPSAYKISVSVSLFFTGVDDFLFRFWRANQCTPLLCICEYNLFCAHPIIILVLFSFQFCENGARIFRQCHHFSRSTCTRCQFHAKCANAAIKIFTHPFHCCCYNIIIVDTDNKMEYTIHFIGIGMIF